MGKNSKEYQKEYNRKYYLAHKEELDAYNRQWFEDHPEKVSEYNRKKEAKRLAALQLALYPGPHDLVQKAAEDKHKNKAKR